MRESRDRLGRRDGNRGEMWGADRVHRGETRGLRDRSEGRKRESSLERSRMEMMTGRGRTQTEQS